MFNREWNCEIRFEIEYIILPAPAAAELATFVSKNPCSFLSGVAKLLNPPSLSSQIITA